MFLMVSAVALLVGPAVASPTPHIENGKSIIDLVVKYNESLSRVRAHLISTTVFLPVVLFATIFWCIVLVNLFM